MTASSLTTRLSRKQRLGQLIDLVGNIRVEPFEDKMKRLVAELRGQQAEGARLDAAIGENLAALGLWERHA